MKKKMYRAHSRGFTLVELLVGIIASFILIGGLFVTFNNINTGIKNANRSNDLTHATRSIFQMIEADLAVAGNGISDLNTLQVHYDTATKSTEEEYFFGIVPQPELNGSSQIIFQWFEYDYLNNPTYMATLPNPGAIDLQNDWVGTLNELTLVTMNVADPELGKIEEGDIFLIYKPNINYNLDVHQNLYTDIDPSTYAWDETTLDNGAMLLQASTVSLDVVNGLAVVEFGAGSTFLNTLTMPLTKFSSPGTFPLAANDAITKGLTRFHFLPPSGTWLARKLSDENGYRRVRYFVNGNNALIRREEGVGTPVDTVLATNVTEFTFWIGTDISDPVTESTPADWNSSVSLEDGTAYWPTEATTQPQTLLIGRHAIAARVKLTIRSLIQDVQDADAGDGTAYKTRTFEKHFRIRNAHRPLVNY